MNSKILSRKKIGLDLSEDVEYVTLEDYASVAKVSKGSSKKIKLLLSMLKVIFYLEKEIRNILAKEL